jgi:hypothetical protein
MASGGTLFIWSQIAADEVISCDINNLSIQSKILKAFPPPDSACRVSLLTGNSHDAEFKKRIANRLGGRKVDFLFIDGDHTEAGVTADYNDYKDFAGPGGIIAFHDIVKEQPLESNQVFHLWERIKQGAETVEFIEGPKQCGFGIGIIRIQQSRRESLSVIKCFSNSARPHRIDSIYAAFVMDEIMQEGLSQEFTSQLLHNECEKHRKEFTYAQ